MQDSVDVIVDEMPASESSRTGKGASTLAFDVMLKGQHDAMVSALRPSAAQIAAAPDLMHAPLWVNPYGPIFNLPGVAQNGGVSLVLTQQNMADIWRGNLTRWNDARLLALNPMIVLPNQPIELVLNYEPIIYVTQFTQQLAAISPEFAAEITPSNRPNWPLAKYAKWKKVEHPEGRASYVSITPYSLTCTLTSYAVKLGASVGSVVNLAGQAVMPTFAAVDASFRELAVGTQRDAAGSIAPYLGAQLSDAPGPYSWPFTLMTMLAIPRRYSRQSCRARSELVKFWLWILSNDNLRYDLGIGENVVMLPHEMDQVLGLSRDLVDKIKCDTDTLNAGQSHSITIAGGQISTYHPKIRDVLLTHYQQVDRSASFQFVQMSPDAALAGLHSPLEAPDVAFIYPDNFRALYPGLLEAETAAGKLSFIPWNNYGAVITYTLPEVALQRVLAAPAGTGFPLKISMEVLGEICVGDVRSWTHPHMLDFNPILASAFAGVDATITLVLFGTGRQEDAAASMMGNTVVLALNHTKAFRNSGIDWRLPVDWRPLMSKLDALGAPYLLARDETELEAQVERIPGGLSFHLSHDYHTEPETEFAIVKEVRWTPEAPLTNHTILGNPAAFLACAEAAVRPDNLGDLELVAVGRRTDAEAAGCWPLSIAATIAMAKDVGLSTATNGLATGGKNLDALCSQQRRLANFANYLVLDPVALKPALLSGSGLLATVPWMAEAIRETLYGLKCDHVPVLHDLPIVWQLSDGIRTLTVSLSICFFALCLVIGGLLVRYRKRTIIYSSNIVLQSASLLGLMMMLVCPLLFVETPSDTTCGLLGWLLCIGATLSYAPIAVKIFRVNHTFKQRRSLKSTRISNAKLYCVVAALLVIDVVLMSAASAEDGSLLQPSVISQLEDDGKVHIYSQCYTTAETFPFVIVLMSIKAAVLALTSVWAFDIRNVSSAFGESASLSWAVWNSTLSCMVLGPLVVLTSSAVGDLFFFLLIFLVLWIAASTLIFVFAYKFITLAREHLAHAAISRTSRSTRNTNSGTTSGTQSGGGTGSGFDLTSALTLPALDMMHLGTLERYIGALENHLAEAKVMRKEQFGDAPTSLGLRPSKRVVVEKDLLRSSARVSEERQLLPAARTTPVTPASTATPLRRPLGMHRRVASPVSPISPSSPVSPVPAAAPTAATASLASSPLSLGPTGFSYPPPRPDLSVPPRVSPIRVPAVSVSESSPSPARGALRHSSHRSPSPVSGPVASPILEHKEAEAGLTVGIVNLAHARKTHVPLRIRGASDVDLRRQE